MHVAFQTPCRCFQTQVSPPGPFQTIRGMKCSDGFGCTIPRSVGMPGPAGYPASGCGSPLQTMQVGISRPPYLQPYQHQIQCEKYGMYPADRTVALSPEVKWSRGPCCAWRVTAHALASISPCWPCPTSPGFLATFLALCVSLYLSLSLCLSLSLSLSLSLALSLSLYLFLYL